MSEVGVIGLELAMAIRTRGSFPSEGAAEKLIALAIRGHEDPSRTVGGWPTVANRFAIMFEGRFTPIPGRGRSKATWSPTWATVLRETPQQAVQEPAAAPEAVIAPS